MKTPLGGLLRDVGMSVRLPAGLPGASDAAAFVQRTLREAGVNLPTSLKTPMARATSRQESKADGPGQFLDRRFPAGVTGRPYKLYVPGQPQAGGAPLIVMLHGCTQSPDDFAAGTRMNLAAERAGCLVAYPEQTASANSSRCWNWFNRTEQMRDRGEPALIAGITRDIMQSHAIDPTRVFVAGLSAGGAAAAIMGATYPDLFAAIGVHSGLACGAAHDMSSAFGAMRDGGAAGDAAGAGIPAIVFHGDRDTTVNPRNADAVVAQVSPRAKLLSRTVEGRVAGGRDWRRTEFLDEAGRVVLEQWAVIGLGHAWSGGSSAGSYTDPTGPDASGEMLRFFLAHPKTFGE